MYEPKLNILYLKYRRGDASFAEVYKAAERQRKVTCHVVKKYFGFDEADALALFDDTIMDLLHQEKVHKNFEALLNSRLKSRRIDLLRKGNGLRKVESLNAIVEIAESKGAATPDALRSDFDLESEVIQIDTIRNRKADHLQVIDFLRDCNPDATTTAIVEAMLSAPASASDNAIAKSIGMHHQTVKRKLTALSRYYDANRFGDYHDYLAV
ncbi:hypothetical protein M6D81_11360 [Paenibacillus sp. J5C_2022]|uniref:hypothetical protein n=1 Tax=Paenibacillus sp. J5C2022 TaxID=2977129 RepID=UPI0021CFDC69|nr:hypothetical protein [Paenibacillus sp. J5C2022]MCU6709304.1 hypothetical protein [Paenibacillus sp. J5C2022]